jgi:hypothetical protein
MKSMLCFLLLLSSTTWAGDIPKGNLFNKIKTLPKGKLLFHWTTKETIQQRASSFWQNPDNLEVNNKVALTYSKNTANYELNESQYNGLYFAPSIHSSSSFGSVEGKGWSLIVFEIPDGVKMLDISADGNKELTTEENDWFLKRDCRIFYISQFNPNSYNSNNPGPCAEALMEYFQEFNISGIAYPWSKLRYKQCSIHQKENYLERAIVIKGDKFLHKKNLSYLDNESFLKTNKEKIGMLVSSLWNLKYDSRDIHIPNLNIPLIVSEEQKSNDPLDKLINCN